VPTDRCARLAAVVQRARGGLCEQPQSDGKVDGSTRDVTTLSSQCNGTVAVS
jgi:hypothetical protein